MLPRWRLPPPFLKTRGDLDAQKRKKTAKEVASPACCERAAERVWVHQPAQYPHPRQHVPRGACPTTPTDRAFDVYNSTPRDFKPPIPRSNPAEACPCPASNCSGLAIDFLAHRPRQEQALFNGLLIGREAEEGCAEAQLTRGQASCLLCPPPQCILPPRVQWGRESPGPSAVARPKRHSGPFADSSYDLGQGLLSCKMGGDIPGMEGQRILDV